MICFKFILIEKTFVYEENFYCGIPLNKRQIKPWDIYYTLFANEIGA